MRLHLLQSLPVWAAQVRLGSWIWALVSALLVVAVWGAMIYIVLVLLAVG